MDVSKYLQVPFVERGRDWHGVDCWGLVCLVYRVELGIELRDWSEIYWTLKDLNPVAIEMAAEIEKKEWISVQSPQILDVVVFREEVNVSHVGLVLDPVKSKMLHFRFGSEGCVEHYNNFYWKNRLDGFYRHTKRM